MVLTAAFTALRQLIVPTLCVGMHPVTLCVTFQKRNVERPWRRSHAERGNDRGAEAVKIVPHAPRGNAARDAPRSASGG